MGACDHDDLPDDARSDVMVELVDLVKHYRAADGTTVERSTACR